MNGGSLYANLQASATYDIRVTISCEGLSSSDVSQISEDVVCYAADRVEAILAERSQPWKR